MAHWGNRTCVAIATTVLALGAIAPGAQAAEQKAADAQMLLVHGYGSSAEGKDCNGSTWKDALTYYQEAGGRDRSSMTTIGYYEGDKPADHYGEGCDAVVGDGKATNDRPIQDIAKDFANYIHDAYTSKGAPVNIVAHSMGGLITRVALLGSAQGWEGFPSTLDVDNVVTLSTPHQGVATTQDDPDRQWGQMDPDSGFMKRLHEKGSELGDEWSKGTDWSLVGSYEDTTVLYDSGIDKGANADQKYGYKDDPDDSGEVSHTGVRELYGENKYSLRYWHSSGDHGPHDTTNGWSPLKAAFQAATKVGDDLPK